MKKKVKVHMLPTGDITGIVVHSTGIDKIVHTKESELNAVLNIGGTSQHLYFTSDEKIEEGDWIYDNSKNGVIYQYNNKLPDELLKHKNFHLHKKFKWRTVVATT